MPGYKLDELLLGIIGGHAHRIQVKNMFRISLLAHLHHGSVMVSRSYTRRPNVSNEVHSVNFLRRGFPEVLLRTSF